MKAFSASIFTDQVQASLKEEAYNLLDMKPRYIKSILEAEDDCIIEEMNARREMYISLLESQQQNLDLIQEGVGGKVIAAIIAACIAIISALIALITGKKSSGSSGSQSSDTTSSSNASASNNQKETNNSSKSNDHFEDEDTADTVHHINKNMHNINRLIRQSEAKPDKNHLEDDYTNSIRYDTDFDTLYAIRYKTGTSNPWMGAKLKYEKEIKEMAQSTTVDITKYTYPNRDVASGNIDSIDDLIEIADMLYNTYISLFEYDEKFDKEDVEENLKNITSKFNAVNSNLDDVNTTGSEESVSMNAASYLSQKFDWFDGYVPPAPYESEGEIKVKTIKPNDKLSKLNTKLYTIKNNANRIDTEKTDKDLFAKAQESAKAFRAAIVKLAQKVSSAYNNYWNMAYKELQQINKISNKFMNDAFMSDVHNRRNKRNKTNSNSKANEANSESVVDFNNPTEFAMLEFATTSQYDAFVHEMDHINEELDTYLSSINEASLASLIITRSLLAGLIVLISYAIGGIIGKFLAKNASAKYEKEYYNYSNYYSSNYDYDGFGSSKWYENYRKKYGYDPFDGWQNRSNSDEANAAAHNPNAKTNQTDTSVDDIKFGRTKGGGGYDMTNPYFIKNSENAKKFADEHKITVDQFKKIAPNVSVEVTDVKFPDIDACTGNNTQFSNLVTLANNLKSAIISIRTSTTDVSEDTKSSIESLKKDLEAAKDNRLDFSSINDSFKSKRTVNAGNYLQTKFKCYDYDRLSESGGGGRISLPGIEFAEPENLKTLRDVLQRTLNLANKIEYEESNQELVTAVKDINSAIVNLRACVTNGISDINEACKKYTKCCIKIRDNVNECSRAVIRKATNQESAKVDYADFSEFYNMVDDTSTRGSIAIHKLQMKAINEEALIFSETGISDYEKYQKLQNVNEALVNKVKKVWYNIIAALKQIMSKFLNNLNASFNMDKQFLERNKEIILRYAFNPNDSYTTQDLSTGIKHIQNTRAPAMNFQQLITAQADTPGVFFTKFMRNTLENPDKEKTRVEDSSTIEDINNFFKSYFCMNGHDVTITGTQFQQHVKDYYDFVYDVKATTRSIEQSIKNIEDTANKLSQQAGADVKQEAVYSILYQKYFTLNENGILVEVEFKNDNVEQNSKEQEDQNEKDVRSTDKSTADTKIQSYANVCSSMLKAKMSACEFIRSEIMQIIRHHVNQHVNQQNKQ